MFNIVLQVPWGRKGEDLFQFSSIYFCSLWTFRLSCETIRCGSRPTRFLWEENLQSDIAFINIHTKLYFKRLDHNIFLYVIIYYVHLQNILQYVIMYNVICNILALHNFTQTCLQNSFCWADTNFPLSINQTLTI